MNLYRREGSRYWQCAAFINGKNRRVSTKEDGLSRAKDFAEDWYLELRGKARTGQLKDEKTFKHAAERFMREFEAIFGPERSAKYIKVQQERIRTHLIPYFGELGLSEITAGKIQDYRIYRNETSRTGKPLARSTIHQELVALRQILKTAIDHQWLAILPRFSSTSAKETKVNHRAWFSPEEYKKLYTATGQRAKNPKSRRWKWTCEQMHDYVLFMANTGLRPDEAARLEYRDVAIVVDEWSGKPILHIKVRGKRGTGWCVSMPGAVRPFERLKERNKPADTDILFPGNHRELFNQILEELELKFDREGNRRTAYSLRHTYISLRLSHGADIYQIANNCRTSVEMIEKYYARHIVNRLDTRDINAVRPQAKSYIGEDVLSEE